VTLPPMSNVLVRWQDRLGELAALAGPLLQSQALQRLRGITFLGVLSPRFRSLPNYPFRFDPGKVIPDDGSRLDHSLGVALTALDIARRFGLSVRGQRYAVAWGLTHDIATWPLAHTSEPAFSTITGWTTGRLREAIVLGEREVPSQYRLGTLLRAIQVEPLVLLRLFERGVSLGDDEELALLSQVIRCPLTPDTLEGVWRCGVVFGISVPDPWNMHFVLYRHNGLACLDHEGIDLVLEYWHRKAEVYRLFINREDVVRWESGWSIAVRREFAGLSLARSMDITEEEILQDILRAGAPPSAEIVRYKEPQDYSVTGSIQSLPPRSSVTELWQVLQREPTSKAQR
jgi:hypothetical protein